MPSPSLVALAAFAILAPTTTGVAQSSFLGFGVSRFDTTWNEPDPVNPIVAIAAGAFHAVARRQNGALTIWGGTPRDTGVVPSLPAGLRYVAVWCGYEATAALRRARRIEEPLERRKRAPESSPRSLGDASLSLSLVSLLEPVARPGECPGSAAP